MILSASCPNMNCTQSTPGHLQQSRSCVQSPVSDGHADAIAATLFMPSGPALCTKDAGCGIALAATAADLLITLRTRCSTKLLGPHHGLHLHASG